MLTSLGLRLSYKTPYYKSFSHIHWPSKINCTYIEETFSIHWEFETHFVDDCLNWPAGHAHTLYGVRRYAYCYYQDFLIHVTITKPHTHAAFRSYVRAHFLFLLLLLSLVSPIEAGRKTLVPGVLFAVSAAGHGHGQRPRPPDDYKKRRERVRVFFGGVLTRAPPLLFRSSFLRASIADLSHASPALHLWESTLQCMYSASSHGRPPTAHASLVSHGE